MTRYRAFILGAHVGALAILALVRAAQRELERREWDAAVAEINAMVEGWQLMRA